MDRNEWTQETSGPRPRPDVADGEGRFSDDPPQPVPPDRPPQPPVKEPPGAPGQPSESDPRPEGDPPPLEPPELV
jgi:hypothetical protein